MLILLIVLTGIMAGIYLVFSIVVMKSLNELPPIQGAQAMNKINDVILNTIFIPIFFGTTLWFAGLIAWEISDWQGSQSISLIAASLIYIVGMFLVTVFGNVPLNNQLKRSENDEVQLQTSWKIYQDQWTRLNHIRSLACAASCSLLAMALIQF